MFKATKLYLADVFGRTTVAKIHREKCEDAQRGLLLAQEAQDQANTQVAYSEARLTSLNAFAARLPAATIVNNTQPVGTIDPAAAVAIRTARRPSAAQAA